MDEISVGDIEQLFTGTLCLYKGTPVKFVSIKYDYQADLKVLEHGKNIRVKFELKDFSAPIGRIGYVNHSNLAFYVTRKTRRQWSAGLHTGNCHIAIPPGMYGHNKEAALIALRGFELKSVHNALKNNYPKFKDALKKAEETEGIYAFDKQFAVNCRREIFYKNKKVGNIPKVSSNTEDIVFNEGYDYLQLPLLQQYEKTVRTFGFA